MGLAGLLLASAGTVVRAADEPLSPELVTKITALLADKQTRTPAQNKLSSELLYAIRMARGEAVAPGVPTQRLSFTNDTNGRVLVDIKANVTDALLAQIRQGGGEVILSFPQYQAIHARIALNQLESLAGLADVLAIKAADRRATRLGRLTTEGDKTHRAGLARTNFNVMGEGVKIGVISDSVDFLQLSLASGDIPTVTILPGQAGFGTGEGTAMLEIVADIAPKAELFFSSSGPSLQSMAQNIRDLRDAGCDIIVDDLGFASESPFQDDVLAQEVNLVTSEGALYFSAAGNSGNKNDGTASAWEGDYKDSGMTFAGAGVSGIAHTYGNTIYNSVTNSFGGLCVLFWSDALNRAANDYDLFVLDPANNNILSSSTTVQNGNDDPFELAVAGIGERIVIIKTSGAGRFLHLEMFPEGQLTISTDGGIRGHPATTNGFGVSAVNVRSALPGVFTGGPGNPVETFTVDGPRRVFFDAAGNVLNTTLTNATNFSSTGGLIRNQPEITAADGVMTTTPGFNPFFGTSAAAPHAAAIAALLKSYNPGLTPQQIRFALTNTALDIEAPGPDRDSGVGILDPVGALASIPPPLPTLIASNLSGGNLNGIIEPNECNELDLVLRNNAVDPAANIIATLTTVTPNVTIAVPTQSYPGIPPGATATNSAPFRFFTSPVFPCGTAIDFTLVVSSSLGLSTNNFTMTSGAIGLIPVAFSNFTVTAIPDPMGTNAGFVDVPIAVTNFPGSIGKVTVAVHILHPSDRDLALQLIAPDGSRRFLSFLRGGASPD